MIQTTPRASPRPIAISTATRLHFDFLYIHHLRSLFYAFGCSLDAVSPFSALSPPSIDMSSFFTGQFVLLSNSQKPARLTLREKVLPPSLTLSYPFLPPRAPQNSNTLSPASLPCNTSTITSPPPSLPTLYPTTAGAALEQYRENKASVYPPTS